MHNLSLGRRHLVNAYEVEAGIGVIVPVSESTSASARLAACIEHLEQFSPLFTYKSLHTIGLCHIILYMLLRTRFSRLVPPPPATVYTYIDSRCVRCGISLDRAERRRLPSGTSWVEDSRSRMLPSTVFRSYHRRSL